MLAETWTDLAAPIVDIPERSPREPPRTGRRKKGDIRISHHDNDPFSREKRGYAPNLA